MGAVSADPKGVGRVTQGRPSVPWEPVSVSRCVQALLEEANSNE